MQIRILQQIQMILIDIAFGGNDRITLSSGLIDLKNDGTQSQIRLYCESANAHYVKYTSGSVS